LATVPSNDVLATFIARVTQETTASLFKTKSLKDIKAATTAAVIKSITQLSARNKDDNHSTNSSAERAHEELPDAMSDHKSDIDSYSDEEVDPITHKVRKPRTVRMFKKIRVNQDLVIIVINRHTRNDSRRPITDLGEFFQFHM
jgi:hypothetical protein